MLSEVFVSVMRDNAKDLAVGKFAGLNMSQFLAITVTYILFLHDVVLYGDGPVKFFYTFEKCV